MNRPLTPAERDLIRWMLDHGEPEAKAFQSQLDQAQATPWRCPCGCPSINLSIAGLPEPSGGLNILAEFIFHAGGDVSGAFVFEKNGTLAGLEIYGLSGDAPKALPTPELLTPMGN